MAVVGVEAQIADALLWYVSQLTTNPAVAVANPGVLFTPSLGVPYLGVSIMPNIDELTGLSFRSTVNHQGLMQVSVFWPAGQGLVKPMQVASQVAAYFAPGTRISRNGLVVQVNEQPRVAPSLQESDWLQVPVIIRTRCFIGG